MVGLGKVKQDPTRCTTPLGVLDAETALHAESESLPPPHAALLFLLSDYSAGRMRRCCTELEQLGGLEAF
jgi:hypothetical protein